MQSLGIKAPVGSYTGYGEWARELIIGLDKLGLNISLEILDENMYNSSKDSLPENVVEVIERVKKPIPRNGPVFTIGTPIQYSSNPNHFNVGTGLFEALRIPQAWLIEMSKMDLIVTSSEFNRELFIRHGINKKKIIIIPPAVDSKRFHPTVKPFYVHTVHPFTILYLGQLILRKGWDKLLIATLKEFNKNDDVCIILKLPPVRYDEQTTAMINKIKEVKQVAGSSKVKIYFNNFAIPIEKVPRVYQIPNQIMRKHLYPYLNGSTPRGVFALPSLGEGIGLIYLEAMASGLLTIGTNITGNSFLNGQNALIVESGKPKRDLRLEMESTLYRGAPFPFVSVDAIRGALRKAYDMNETERRKIINVARKEAENFTYEKTCTALITAIQSHL